MPSYTIETALAEKRDSIAKLHHFGGRQLGVGSEGDVTGKGETFCLEQSACVLSKSNPARGVLKEILVDSERSELKHLLSCRRIQ